MIQKIQKIEISKLTRACLHRFLNWKFFRRTIQKSTPKLYKAFAPISTTIFGVEEAKHE